VAASGRSGGKRSGGVGVALVGTGNFATATLIPALKRLAEVRLVVACSAGGLSATSVASRHGFARAASDFEAVLSEGAVDAVVIATRHDTHASFASRALLAGKDVFVEKPLALTVEQLEQVVEAQRSSGRVLMPGFNRRFSPLSRGVRAFLDSVQGPLEVVCRVNAGAIASDSWYQDPDEGGWRIVSEGCHFVDLIQYLAGSTVEQVFATMVGGRIPGGQNDNCAVTLKLANGSIGSLLYFANGDSAYEKERIEVFGGGRSAVIENFRRAMLWSGGKGQKVRARAVGNGHVEEMAAFVAAVGRGAASPIPMTEAVATTRATLAIERSLRSGACVSIDEISTAAGGEAL